MWARPIQLYQEIFGRRPSAQVLFNWHVVSFQYVLGCSSGWSQDTAVFGSVYRHLHQDLASGAVVSRLEYWEEEKRT